MKNSTKFGLAGLVISGIAALTNITGCTPQNESYLSVSYHWNTASVHAKNEKGISYFRVISQDGKVAFDSRNYKNFSPGSRKIDEAVVLKEMSPEKEYYLEIIDMEGKKSLSKQRPRNPAITE